MRHNWFKATDDSFDIVTESANDAEVWSFTTADGLTALDSVTPSELVTDAYYKATISTPVDDCFVLTRHDGIVGIVRAGDPEVLTIAYTGLTGETHSYVQYAIADGAELDSGDMVEAGEGFYYVEPASLDDSFFVLNDGALIKNLHVPYMVVEVAGDGAIESDGYFGNTGFNMFGFLGERHSYFDLDQGKWINDDAVEAKASDLAKAVCYKYGLVWDDDTADDWIGNYIKYVRSYTENDGYIRYYKPYKTPDDNDANFALMQDDEAGNLVVKGISILLLQTLETIDGTDGVTIPFKEV